MSAVDARMALLSPNERRILERIADGLCNKTICRETGMAYGTVRTHVHNMLKKLRARDRTHAAVIYLRWQFENQEAA